VALILGTSTGGIRETERAWEIFVNTGLIPSTFDYGRQHCFDGLLTLLQKKTGIGGPCYVVSTACSSSGKVFGVAQRLLGADFVDAVLIGGVDTLCHTTLRGFHSLQLLSKQACRPFAEDRDGLSIGEGAAWLILERDGDGLASLLGVGESCDAHHISQPHPQGKGAYLAMSKALWQAGISPEEVDYINAHGTATPSNDLAEGQAIAALFGARTPVVSTKGYTGHMLGASGATEAVFSIISIMQGYIPLSLGAKKVDPAISILINSQEKKEQRCQLVLSNSFAFGGNNVSVLLGAPQ
jgi:3-oxoacyl-[acyl-carrier-protein] synthase-1